MDTIKLQNLLFLILYIIISEKLRRHVTMDQLQIRTLTEEESRQRAANLLKGIGTSVDPEKVELLIDEAKLLQRQIDGQASQVFQ